MGALASSSAPAALARLDQLESARSAATLSEESAFAAEPTAGRGGGALVAASGGGGGGGSGISLLIRSVSSRFASLSGGWLGTSPAEEVAAAEAGGGAASSARSSRRPAPEPSLPAPREAAAQAEEEAAAAAALLSDPPQETPLRPPPIPAEQAAPPAPAGGGASEPSHRTVWALLLRAVASNTQPLLWASLVYNHAADASLLSLPPAASVFLYAALEAPRPARGYSAWLLRYFVFVVVLKAVYQLPLVCAWPSFSLRTSLPWESPATEDPHLAVCVEPNSRHAQEPPTEILKTVRLEELTKSFLFQLGLRKHSGPYAAPPGQTLLAALTPPILAILALLLDREIADATGAFDAARSEIARQASSREESRGGAERSRDVISRSCGRRAAARRAAARQRAPPPTLSTRPSARASTTRRTTPPPAAPVALAARRGRCGSRGRGGRRGRGGAQWACVEGVVPGERGQRWARAAGRRRASLRRELALWTGW